MGVGKFGGSLGAPPPKGEKRHPGHICTIVQNFTPIGATVAEISVTKKRMAVNKRPTYHQARS